MKINFKIQEKCVDRLFYLQRKDWIITIVIFLVIFVFALVVWRDCILNPQPSETTLSNILKIEQEYKTKMSNIEKNHQTLKDQIEKFDNPERALENKDYFEIPEQIDSATFNYMPNTQNFNPEIVL